MNKKERILYQEKAKVLKALSHPTRLWMAETLGDGEQCVAQFVEATGTDYSTISKHLSVLKQAGVVTDDKRGKQVYYQLNMPCLREFTQCIETVIQSRIQASLRMWR